MRRALVVLVLLAPSAVAVSVEMSIEDARGDVATFGHGAATYPSADILRASSTLVDGSVWQRVEMAARPIAPDDSILVRSWFRNSTNGSFYALDLEVDGGAPDPAARFKPVLRNGSFDAPLVIPARYGLDNATWIFEINASLLADAECFTLTIIALHTPKRGLQGIDEIPANGDCQTGVEPMDAAMPPPVAFNIVSPTPEPAQSGEPPGSRAPTPLTPAIALAAFALAILLGRDQRQNE